MEQLSPLAVIAIVATAIMYLSKAGFELVLLVKKQKNGGTTTGVYCNYPSKGGCVWQSDDFTELRKIQIANSVSSTLKEPLDEQNRLLGEIKDAINRRGYGR